MAMGTCVPCFIVKVHVTLTLKRMSQCIVNDFYYKYNAITRISGVSWPHIQFHAYSFKHFNVRGYRNSSVKKVRINKQPGRFLTSQLTIFQSYMWRHRCAGGLKKKLYLRSGSQRHRHFAGFFNVSVLHRHGTTLFIRWFRHTAPFSRLLRPRWGYGGHILDLTPPPQALMGGVSL